MNSAGPLAFLLSATLLCTACGEDPPAPTEEAAAPNKETLLETLFASQDEEALQENIKAARAGGVSEQAILEARFISIVDSGNNATLGALAKELETAAANFKVEDSAIFTVKEEFLAIVQYAHALAALDAGDKARFKKHITEAFWLSPNQGPAFAPHIERLRLKEAMSALKIDFQRTLLTQDAGKPLTLAEATGDATYVLLHFWSPWSEECGAFLDDFIATSAELSKHGVAVISILAESAPDALADAKEVTAGAGKKATCQWLLDNPDQPLSRELRLANVPTCALIHKDGSVLFNGHPAENDLWKELQLAVPKIKRPELPAPPPTADEIPNS